MFSTEDIVGAFKKQKIPKRKGTSSREDTLKV